MPEYKDKSDSEVDRSVTGTKEGVKDVENDIGGRKERFRKNKNPYPTYFFSHGGPTFMYEDDPSGNRGAWRTIRKLGANIKSTWKPDYLIVVSAHWQSEGEDLIEVNCSPEESGENPLIYDFYNFPSHMYEEKFRTLNSKSVGEIIKEELQKSGFRSKLTKRGIDHGVWVPFKVAFSNQEPFTDSSDLPGTKLIQVSLTSSDSDFDAHFKLGEVLSKFRDNYIWDETSQTYLKGAVICSGMSVHNLREWRRAASTPGLVLPYTKEFGSLLTETLVNSKTLLKDLTSIKSNKRELLYNAHPTLEHFLPVVVASGIASESGLAIKELYNQAVGSLGWGIYQFGDDYST